MLFILCPDFIVVPAGQSVRIDHSSLHVTFNEPALIVTLLFQPLNGSLYTGHSLRSPETRRCFLNIPLNPRAKAVSFNMDNCLPGTEEGCEADLHDSASVF